MAERILLVDDEPNVLRSYRRGLAFEYDVETACGGTAGLELITNAKEPFAVVVSDMRMPEMDGSEFLSQVRQKSPGTSRILLTGHADLKDAVAVVNEGGIFRFLTKPCEPELYKRTLNEGIALYRSVTAEKELLSKTLRGSVKVLMDVISMTNPNSFKQSQEVRDLANKVAKRLRLPNLWQVDLAALLSRIGYVAVPSEILAKKRRGDKLSMVETKKYYNYLHDGHKLIRNIPRLREIAEAILYQEKRFDGEGPPEDNRIGQSVPMISRILKIVNDFDEWMQKEQSAKKAYKKLLHQKARYDPHVFDALKQEIWLMELDFSQEIEPEKITVGMIAAEDIKTVDHLTLVSKNQEISEAVLMVIMTHAQINELVLPVKVFA